MPFGISDDDQREFIVKNRDEVQRHVQGELIAYCPCFRTGSYGGMAIAKASPLAGLVTNMIGKKKAGGLPQNFVVTVTADKVQAFKYRPRGWTLKLGDEAAAWDRRTLSVSAEKTQMTTRVTLEGEGETIVFDTNKGSIGDDLVAALV
jgi:hypothetical protein